MLKHIILGIFSFSSSKSIEIEQSYNNFETLPLWSRVLEKASEKYSELINSTQFLEIDQRRGPQTEQNSAIRNQINPILVETLTGYGCWCFFDGTMGRAQAQDEYDSICRLLSNSYECAMIEIDGCVPWDVPYNDVDVNFIIGDNVFTPVLEN